MQIFANFVQSRVADDEPWGHVVVVVVVVDGVGELHAVVGLLHPPAWLSPSCRLCLENM